MTRERRKRVVKSIYFPVSFYLSTKISKRPLKIFASIESWIMFRFRVKLRRRYRDFPYTPCLHTAIVSSIAHFFLVLNAVSLFGLQLFIHSLCEGHLGSFQVLVIMIKSCYKHLCTGFCVNITFQLGKYQEMQVLDHMVRICLVL